MCFAGRLCTTAKRFSAPLHLRKVTGTFADGTKQVFFKGALSLPPEPVGKYPISGDFTGDNHNPFGNNPVYRLSDSTRFA